MLECQDIYDYQLLIEMLRDTAVYGKPYFQVIDIIPCKENGFREFDKVLK